MHLKTFWKEVPGLHQIAKGFHSTHKKKLRAQAKGRPELRIYNLLSQINHNQSKMGRTIFIFSAKCILRAADFLATTSTLPLRFLLT